MPLTAAYETALPDDPRIQRKRMFGTPCAFVNRQMFFGIFEDTLVARIGPARVKTLAGKPGMRVFAPSEGKTWADTLQLDADTDPAMLAALAAEAINYAANVPKHVKWSSQ